MLDIGWPELMLIAVATIIVVGPRELPRVLRTVNGYIRKARSLASDFQNSVEDMAREADLEDLKKQWKETGSDFSGDLEKSMDPTGEVSSSMRDIKDSMNERYTDGSSSAPGNSVVPPAEEMDDGTAAAEAVGLPGADEAPAKKAAAKKTAAKKSGARKAAAKKTTAKKATAKKAAAKKSASKTTGAKKAVGKKSAAKSAAPAAGAASAPSGGGGSGAG